MIVKDTEVGIVVVVSSVVRMGSGVAEGSIVVEERIDVMRLR